MPAERPVIELVKLPVTRLSEVRLSAMVGINAVLQHTPHARMVSPPSEVMVPPHCAVVWVMAVIVYVVSIGTDGLTGSEQQSLTQPVGKMNNNIPIQRGMSITDLMSL